MERYGVTVQRSDALFATLDLEGLIVDVVAMMLNLDTRMDGFSLSVIGILMHDKADRAEVRINDTCNRCDG